MESFAGRVAVVTGGGSGIGRALAVALAREGARVVVADVVEPALRAVVAEIEAEGGRALGVPTDVSDRRQVHALAARAADGFGGVDLLCNNAGVVLHGGIEAATHEDWQWVLGVNLWGVIHGIEAFVPAMIRRGEGGHVVNTASAAGLVATRGLGVYNTSKYAVVGLSETLAKDLRPWNIGVTVLCPMGVATRIRQAGRNRPAALGGGRPAAGEPVELMGGTLPPEQVADMTLAAVRANELYVITHAEVLEPVRRRFERLERAIHRTRGAPTRP